MSSPFPAGAAVPDGLREVADRADRAFGTEAPAILRKWAAEPGGDRRFAQAAELLEKDHQPKSERRT
jgi:hypothetical protein